MQVSKTCNYIESRKTVIMIASQANSYTVSFNILNIPGLLFIFCLQEGGLVLCLL